MEDINDIKWVKLTDTMGSISAEVIAGRLRAEGIPCWVWQQGAGDAMGLIVGPLGFGHVMVPETMKDMALEIISEEQDPDLQSSQEFPEDPKEEMETRSINSISKALLLILALAIDIPAVLIAFVIAFFAKSDNQNRVICPHCQSQVELNRQEITQSWYNCPHCEEKVILTDTE